MTLSARQKSIKEHDFDLGNKQGYFLKLIEEVGELSQAIANEKGGQPNAENLKGSIAEELNDIVYYACALANVYDVDLDETYALKEKLNRIKYNR